MFSRTPPTLLLPVAILAGTLGLVALARAQAPAGGPPGGAPPPKPLLRVFAGSNGSWAWIKETGEQSELFTGRPSAPGRLRAKGTHWTEVAQDGPDLWVLGQAGSGAILLRLPREGDAPPAEVARSADPAGGLLAQDGKALWLEVSAPADQGLAFVPPLGGRIRLRCREADGSIKTLLDRPAVQGAQPGSGDVVALSGGQVYLRLRSASGTELLSVPVQGGRSTVIAGETGTQQALLSGGRLFWTAPSEEATPESGIYCLRRVSPAGTPETVAEWLPANGNLVQVSDGLRFVSGFDVYRLPERFGAPVFLRKLEDVRVVSDGQSLVRVGTGEPALDAAGPR